MMLYEKARKILHIILTILNIRFIIKKNFKNEIKIFKNRLQ